MTLKFITKFSPDRLQKSITHFETKYQDFKIHNIGIELSQVKGIASVYWMVVDIGNRNKKVDSMSENDKEFSAGNCEVDKKVKQIKTEWELEAERLLNSSS